MGDAGDYKTPQSTGNRLRNRCKYDCATVHALIDSCPVLHVSFNSTSSDEPFPTILPMLGITGNFIDQASLSSSGPRSIYLHGHAASRLMKAPSNSGNVDGLPVCIAGTLMDGLVLTYTPFHNSCNYRSVVAYGYAVPVIDEAERDYAMTMITDNLLPGRWANSRLPNKAELTSTGILRVEIQSASAKVRTGATGEDRKDLKDEKLRETTWVGVIPAAQQWGKPVPSEDNRVEKVPEYIESHIANENQEAKKYSENAIHIK